MYTLYGSAGSGSAAVEAALVIAGVPYCQIVASTWEPESALAELERVNPLKQIPTLVMPNGCVMTESAAILITLGLAYPSSGLLPTDEAQRMQAIRGLVFIAANCYSAIGVIDYPERWCDDINDEIAGQIRSGTKNRLHRQWKLFADTFAASDCMADDKVSALGLLASVVSRWSGARAYLKKERPEFLVLLERIDTHPQTAMVFARHWNA